LAAGDFNGDTFDDLAIGVPRQDVGDVLNAGVVQILFGSSNGLTSAGNQIWHQNTSGILDVAEQDDHFGSSLAAGNFSGDQFDDLAIGVVDEAVGTVPEAGAVNVLYGSGSGLTSAGNQFWTQNSSGVLDVSEDGDQFGFALTAGDFNGDNNRSRDRCSWRVSGDEQFGRGCSQCSLRVCRCWAVEHRKSILEPK
jgi:hypothetical protein